ncbi:hypothetical protein HK105_203759 [Polyrhizophydium stewartii]|uniref:Uncharacterized protein n=1 Tax=Polyrhizophydium stewartii TaxID=2732419 RepID=A0ABR4NAT9_9FUNG
MPVQAAAARIAALEAQAARIGGRRAQDVAAADGDADDSAAAAPPAADADELKDLRVKQSKNEFRIRMLLRTIDEKEDEIAQLRAALAAATAKPGSGKGKK